MPDQFVIVDGSSYFYRAFYAIPRLATSRGFPTNAIKGFLNMLRKVLRKHHPRYVAMVFDAAERSFRNDLFTEYKAHRPPMPDDLARQIPVIKKIPRAYRIPTLELAGFEADDIIATLATRAASQGLEAVVVTADKDLMQVVSKRSTDAESPGVVLYDDSKDRRIGIDEVVEKFGVKPELVADVQALTGDSVDNIPGIRGIGEKTAAALISQHGSLEEILHHPERVEREKIREKLVEGRETALLSKKLATLVTDLPIETRPDKFAPGEEDREELVRLFRELEFGSELKELQGKGVEKRTTLAVREYSVGQGEEEFCRGVSDKIAVRLVSSGRFGKIHGVALASAPGKALYAPISPPIRALLENASIRKVVHDLKDLHGQFSGASVTLDGPVEDVMLASYLINPDQSTHSLERLASDQLGHDLPRVPISEERLLVEEAGPSACEGADALLQIEPILARRLAEGGLEKIYREIELPLARVLADIESAGVKIDVEFLRGLSAQFDERMKTLEKEAYRAAGFEFNLASPKQLGVVLFEKLKLPVVKRTETGPSTDHEVLETLAAKHALPALVLRHRGLAKLKGTYVDALPALVRSETGRVHTHYNQAVAATGRLSSSDPGLQNIPIRTEEGRLIRKAFVAEPGNLLVIGDYSQIELRLLAHMSEDPALIRAFREGRDIHAQTAAEVFEVMPDLVTPDMRRKAKEVNFGIIYGMSAYGLAQRLDIPQPEAKRYIERYFARYPGVRRWLDATMARARETGYVETAFGRRRYVPGIDSKNGSIRGAAERVATNAPLQGTAADVIKIAMIRLHEKLQGAGARMILQVHDELVVEAPEGAADSVGRTLKSEMENVQEFRVPLVVEVGTGNNWGEAK
jgi:DNA polymerase-1